jgi:dihydroflavonol-4-reductase
MILVTGGTGMLGAHLLLELALRGEKVKALKRAGSNTAITEKIFSWHAPSNKVLYRQIEWVEGDVNDPESLAEAFSGISRVYHSAATVSFSKKDDAMMMRNNIGGTANVVNACLDHNIQKLCHVSSIAALGSSLSGEPVTEETKWQPSRKSHAYAVSKYQSELQVWRGISEGLNAIIVNPSVIIGPGNWQQGSPSMIRVVDKGLKFYTKGTTGFVDVRDVAKCMIALMESPVSGERFILNSENVPYRKFFTMVAKELGVSPPKWHASKALLEIAWRLDWLKSKLTFSRHVLTKTTARSGRNTTFYSNEKIKEAIGFEFISVQEAIKNVCEIYRREEH